MIHLKDDDKDDKDDKDDSVTATFTKLKRRPTTCCATCGKFQSNVNCKSSCATSSTYTLELPLTMFGCPQDARNIYTFLRDDVLAETDREISWDYLDLPHCMRFLRNAGVQLSKSSFDFGAYRKRVTDLWCSNAERFLLTGGGGGGGSKQPAARTRPCSPAEVYCVLEWLVRRVDCGGDSGVIEHPAFLRLVLLYTRSGGGGRAAADRVVKMVQVYLNKTRRRFEGESSGSARAGENARRRQTTMRRLGMFVKNLVLASYCTCAQINPAPRRRVSDTALFQSLIVLWGADSEVLQRLVYPLFHLCAPRERGEANMPLLCGICCQTIFCPAKQPLLV